MNNKYNFFDIQNRVSSFWKSEKTYQTQSQKNNNFIIDTPPPTVSGNLHIGHIFSYTHQDILARYKRMKGFNIIYPFGFDDNGLPTERYIEKKMNIMSNQYPRNEFIKICLEENQEIYKKFIYLWQKLGLSCDWDLVYSTISKDVQYVSQKSFIDLYKKGYIYKKNEPAIYCTAFKTSISQADLEEVEKESAMITIAFKESQTNENILIATTRPELLAGCVAVLIHPDDNRFNYLIGKKAIVPIYEQEVLIISDTSVIPEKGTGIVMSATFGDALDVYWFKKHNFIYKKVINNDGTLTDLTLFLSGMKVEQARIKIIEKLALDGYIVESKKIIHKVSVYERSKKEVEYIMLNQWFVSILPFKEEFLKLADQLNWHPAYMKHRYIDWVKNLSWDWCISRQRVYGIPFPVWYDNDGNVLLANMDQLPIDPLIDLPDGFSRSECIAELDVMDTWNTSSLTPYIIQYMLKNKNMSVDLPLSMRPQSHDIIRTWAFDTIVKAYLTEKKLPWTDIVISGHVISNNQKISKSKENSPLDPENLLEKYPADVVRFWTASAKLGTDISFSEYQLKDGNRLIIKLFNAALCIKDFSAFDYTFLPNSIIIYEKVNAFIMKELFDMLKKYYMFFDDFDYNGALKTIEQFFWFFCDQYLEIIKVYQHKSDLFDRFQVEETSKISGYVFLEILKCLSPFIPFITEHLFQEYYVFSREYISLSFLSFPKNIINYIEPYFKIIINSIELMRKAKTEKQMSLKTKINILVLKILDKDFFAYIDEDDSIKRIYLIMSNALNIQYYYEPNIVETEFRWIESQNELNLEICINSQGV